MIAMPVVAETEEAEVVGDQEGEPEEWARYRQLTTTEVDDDFSIIPDQHEGGDDSVDIVAELDAAVKAAEEVLHDMDDNIKYISIPAEEPQEQIVQTKKGNHLSIQHLALHLLADPVNCRACRLGKATRAYARKRQVQGVTYTGADAEDVPFGAMLHLDHWTFKQGCLAARSAPAALKLLDEKTKFRGTIPTNSRDHETVIEQVRSFEEANKPSRRWWTDSAPEFKAAARELRKTRTLDHYTSPPHRPTANGIIERSNRTTIEGANAAIYNSGFDAPWWIVAAPFCDIIDKDGQTAWYRRFKEHPRFQLYPWGALVFVIPPRALAPDKDKFQLKMKPHLLVAIGIGPGFTWNKTYGVVPLWRFLGEKRVSRATIRYTMDVEFPDTPSFPLKLKLTAAGAIGDITLPSPMVKDITQPFGVIDAPDDESDMEPIDGHLQENAPRLTATYFEAVALDPKVPQDIEAEEDATPIDAPPFGEDETQIEGIRPPRAWRIDVLPGGRQVSVPPWSTRPPRVSPEDWIMMSRITKRLELEAWKLKDPKGFELQKTRRDSYNTDKLARKQVSAAA